MPESSSCVREIGRTGLAAFMAAIAVALIALVTAPASAQAAAPSCGYGTGGPFASNLCWFDMSSYDDTAARSAAGQAMSINLPGGYVASFTVTSRPVAGVATHQTVAPRATPIENRFAFGSTGADGGYRDVPGKPALYSSSGGGGVALTLSNIQVVDSSGLPVTGYRFVIADAENNVTGENFTWTSDKNLDLIGVLNDDAPAGCNVPPGLTGIGTTTVTCTGRGGADTTDPKYDAVVVGADTPSTIGLSMTTFARSGVAFGILTSKIEVKKAVAGRIRSSDSFDVSATSPEGSTIASASTGSSNSATTGELTVLPRTNGASYTLSEAVTPGSGTQQADYTRSWSCTNNDQPDPSLPSGSGASIAVSPKVGDDILCTVTNTQIPAQPVTCASDANVFNTGYNAATGGILANGSNDANWQVAGPFYTPTGTSPASQALPPPVGAVFGPAVVGNQAPGSWTASPYGNAQWISQAGTGGNAGDWYYRFQFNLDPSVDPSTFALKMNFLADNDVAEVYVNGVAQSGQTTGIPQNTSNPYFYVGFALSHAAQTTLNHNWRTGLNTIVVQIKSFPGAEGFDAQIVPSAVCPVDLAITKSATPNPYTPGQPLTYKVEVTNGGPGTASGLSVSDPLPAPLAGAGFTWTCTATSGSSCKASGSGDISDSPLGSYPGPKVLPGGKLTYTVTGTVRLSTTGSLSNTARLTPPPGTSDPGCTPSCSSTTNTPSVPLSDLKLTKTADPAVVSIGQQITYALTATNDGPNGEPNATVTDTLPGGVNYVSDDASCSTASLPQVTCNLGPIAKGTSRTIHITVSASLLAANSTQHNSAVVSGQNLDTNQQNNAAAADVFVRPVADLSIEKSVDPSLVNPGDTVTFALTVQNHGPDLSPLATVTDNLPSGLTYASSDGICLTLTLPQISCTIGPLANGASQTIHIVATVKGNAGGTVQTNSASVAGLLTDPVATNNSDTADVDVLPLSDLSVAKSAPSTVRAGHQLTYTLDWANNGPTDSPSQTVVTDTLPSGVSYVSDDAGCDATNLPTITCKLGAVPDGASGSIHITVAVDPETRGGITNAASIDGPNNDQNPSNDSDTADTDVGPPLTDLEIEKTADPNVINPGDPVSYTITVTNHGPDDSLSERVTDTLPGGLHYESDDGGCDTSALPKITCDLPALANGDSTTIHVATTSGLGSGGTVQDNSASVTGDGEDPDSSNNQATARILVTPLSDLSVTKTASDDAIRAGHQLTYTLDWANNGPTDSPSQTAITDTLPAGVTYVSDDGGCDTTNLPAVTCNLGPVASGASGTIHITVGVDTGTRGQIQNTASINGPNNDQDPTNNSDDAATDVSAPATDLAIQKDVSPATAEPIAPNNAVTYTLTVTNNGPDDSPSAQVTDTLPAGLHYVSDDAGCDVTSLPTLSCDLGPLADGDSATVHIDATVDSGAGGSTISNTASVSGPGDDSDQSNNSDGAELPVTALSDLSLTKTVSDDAIRAGHQLTYTLDWANDGPTDSPSQTAITDTLPAGVTYVSDDGGCETTNLPTITCKLGAVANGASGTIHVTVAVDSATRGQIQNSASIDGPNDDQDSSNDSDSATTDVSAPATDLAIQKDVSPGVADPVGPNNAVTYTLTVTNNGPDDSPSAEITDTLPAELNYVSDDGGCDATSLPTISCDLSALANGDSATVHIDATVDPGAGGSVVDNTASVSGPGDDADQSNNSDGARLLVTPLSDLSVSKSVSADTIRAGHQLIYTLDWANNGPTNSPSQTTITDSLPAGVTYVSDDGNCDATGAPTITCQLGAVPNGASGTIHIVVSVDQSTRGQVRNSASIDGPNNDQEPDNDSDQATTQVNPGQSDLSMTKTAPPGPFSVGQQIPYTLKVTNDGPDDAPQVVVTDELPAGLSYVSDDAGCDASAPPRVECHLGALANGVSRTITVMTKVDAVNGSSISNTASVRSGNDDPDPGDDTGSATAALAASATGGNKCFFGHRVTILGTNKPERILGTPGPDVINGRGGNDVILGLAGDDLICGGAGDDLIEGGLGNDRVKGSTGNDRIRGNEGADWLRGAPGNDLISGSQGNDKLMGNNGNDRLRGKQGNDFLLGGPGFDWGNGGPGMDRALGLDKEFRIEG